MLIQQPCQENNIKMYQIIVHNSVVGHHGFERTLQKLHFQGYNWSHMRVHVKTFINQLCPCCQKMNPF